LEKLKKIIVNRDNLVAAEINGLDENFKNAEVINDQGLFFKIPFITKVETHTSKLLTYQAQEEAVTTKDRKKIRSSNLRSMAYLSPWFIFNKLWQ
jgi:hypothetical protein